MRSYVFLTCWLAGVAGPALVACSSTLIDPSDAKSTDAGVDGDAGAADAPPSADANVSDASVVSVKQIGLGGHHTCAVLSTGAVRCWGMGSGGALGYGNTETVGDNETPASTGDVKIGLPATQVGTGKWHTCALLFNGKVRCWGANTSGELGYANSKAIGDNETPASAGDVDVGGTVTQIAVGLFHTCALLSTGAVRCWGMGDSGRLGYGSTKDVGDNETPAALGDVNVGGTVTQISAGYDHTCALLSTGSVRCWGSGVRGALGYGNQASIGDDEAPASAGDVNVGGPVIQIAAGSSHTCALLSTGSVRCWGDGGLGYGKTTSIGDDETPASAGDVNVGGTVAQIATGESRTCALLTTGALRCWGRGVAGALGYGNTNDIGDDETPASAGDVAVGAPVVQVASGQLHTCALLSTGAVRCWGEGKYGALGYANTNTIGDDEPPSSAGAVPML